MTENVFSFLLVDDDSSYNEINKILLEKFGFRIDVAETKADALLKVIEHSYTIALVDLRLVDDDPNNFEGIEIIKSLREKSSQTHILVKSSFVSVEVEQQLSDMGINKDAILDKSTTNKDFIELITKVLQEIKGN